MITDWQKFYELLSPPTVEFYDKLARLGMLTLTCIFKPSQEAEDELSGMIVRMGQESESTVLGMLFEIVQAHAEAEIES